MNRLDWRTLDSGSAIQYLSKLEQTIRDAGRELAEIHPAVRRPIERLWDLYIQAYVYGVSRMHARQYAHRTSLDPFRVVWVDPDRITHTVERDGYPEQTRSKTLFPTPKFKHAGTVRDGDWDQHGMRFENTELYRSFEAHFRRNVDWEETPFFETAVEHIEDGTPMWRCTSREQFERRCTQIDSLYESIATHSYRSQADLISEQLEDPVGSDASRTVRLVFDELTVCVGREGELLFLDGRNRLAIAKLLGLDSIPVWILVRHARWQQFREDLSAEPDRCGSFPPRLRTHPDLREICFGEPIGDA